MSCVLNVNGLTGGRYDAQEALAQLRAQEEWEEDARGGTTITWCSTITWPFASTVITARASHEHIPATPRGLPTQ